jgi:hypothetical protein
LKVEGEEGGGIGFVVAFDSGGGMVERREGFHRLDELIH